MIKKHDSELHSWLSGEWKRKLSDASFYSPSQACSACQPSRRTEGPRSEEDLDKRLPAGGGLFGADDWIDELEILDAIFEDE